MSVVLLREGVVLDRRKGWGERRRIGRCAQGMVQGVVLDRRHAAGVRRVGEDRAVRAGRVRYGDRINSLGWTMAFTMSNRHEHIQYE